LLEKPLKVIHARETASFDIILEGTQLVDETNARNTSTGLRRMRAIGENAEFLLDALSVDENTHVQC
jgi:hypothetical protein